MNKGFTVKKIVIGGIIAAIYAAASLALAPISFGAVQFRVAEAMTLLPVLSAEAVLGVTLGCAITNAAGVFLGANILGPVDIVLGSAATLIAAILTRLLARYRLKGLPILAALPPVLVNAVVIGGELMWATSGGQWNTAAFGLFAGQVALGQLFACFGLGLPLLKMLEKAKLFEQ